MAVTSSPTSIRALMRSVLFIVAISTPPILYSQSKEALKAQAQAEKEATKLQKSQAQFEKKARQLCSKHSTWALEQCRLVLNKQIVVGMDFDMVRAVSKPSNVVSKGSTESWFFSVPYLRYDPALARSSLNSSLVVDGVYVLSYRDGGTATFVDGRVALIFAPDGKLADHLSLIPGGIQ